MISNEIILKGWQTIEDYLNTISKISKKHEIEIRVNFLNTIRDICSEAGVEISFNVEKRTKKGKYTDLLINGVLIETKNVGVLQNKRELKKSLDQIEGYIKSEMTPYAVLTDFDQIMFLELTQNNTVKSGALQEFSFKTYRKLIELITSQNRKRYISELQLATDFTPEKPPVKTLIKALYNGLKKGLKDKQKVLLLFQEWEKLFKIAETSNRRYEQNRRKALSQKVGIPVTTENEYEVLFCLHTSLSVVLKTIMSAVVQKSIKEPVEKDLYTFYKKTESGEIFRKAGIKNFCNYDFFSWYLEVDWDEDLRNCLQQVKSISELYENLKGKKVKDVLQRLYFEFIPREVRHSFGEYYTPEVVADYMVEESYKVLNDINFKSIDPTCGSGTFIVSLIKFKKEKGVPLKDITNQVHGIDLNPISVLMSRFNYLNTLLDLFGEDDIPVIEIPVYIGDSSYTPQKEKRQDVECLVYQYYFHDNEGKVKVEMPEIVFPLEFVKSPEFIDVLVEVERKIELGLKEKDIVNYLISKIEKVSTLHKEVKEQIEALVRTIIQYHKKNLNMIWLYIFMNYLKPFSHDGYDLVIGNPPWVRWSNLPDSYRAKIKRTLREEGLFSKDKNYGGVDLNICALIGYRAADNLSKEDTIIFFVMPEGILTNKSFEGYRKWKYNLTTCKPIKIYKPLKSFFEGEEPVMLMLKCSQKESGYC